MGVQGYEAANELGKKASWSALGKQYHFVRFVNLLDVRARSNTF